LEKEVAKQNLPMRSLCVFCGSNSGIDPIFKNAAQDMGRYLSQSKITLVYGGASIGLMGEIADSVLVGGGRVIGVLPKKLVEREIAHPGISELKIVDSMHERKALMAELSDAFIAMPGGFGTLDELCEVLTWIQISIHDKPCGLLNVGGYYDAFLSFLDGAVQAGFIEPRYRQKLICDSDPVALVRRLAGPLSA
jgi:uncharacterized protein (TIGR00730 family)